MQTIARRSLWLVAALALAILLLGFGGSPAQAQSDNPDLWYAEFFGNMNMQGTPVVTRWDRTINFRWFGGAPDSRVPDDQFSARWTRRVPFAAGTYRFTATMDDGMRVFLNNTLIIDSWTRSQEHTMTVDRFVPAGNHDIRVEFFEDGGQATAIFNWALVGSDTAPVGPQFPNWQGVYFNRPDLTGAPVLVRDDRYLNQNWGASSPGPGVNEDFWSARWTRTIATQPGNYTIRMTSDDGSRMFINGVLIIDNWIDQTTTRSANYVATGATINVVVEYYDNFGPAFLQVDLIPLGGTVPPVTGTCNVTPTGLNAVVTATTVLNVRRSPTTQSEAMTQLQPCQTVPMTGFRSSDSQWVQVILLNRQTGWVFAQYVNTGVPISTLTVAP